MISRTLPTLFLIAIPYSETLREGVRKVSKFIEQGQENRTSFYVAFFQGKTQVNKRAFALIPLFTNQSDNTRRTLLLSPID